MWKSEVGLYDIFIVLLSKEIFGKGEMVVLKIRYWIGL